MTAASSDSLPASTSFGAAATVNHLEINPIWKRLSFALIGATSSEGLAGSLAVVRDADLRRSLRLIDAPTLVIGGKDDTITLASHSEQIASEIPGAALVLMPGVHMLNV